jgi:NDP-sugar pyrophosphorylase family protein
MVLDYIPEKADFFLVNGDTFFQFDLEKMYQLHIKNDALLTLSSIELISKSGIILEENGKVVDFVREVRVPSFSFAYNHSLRGYIHTGLAWINKDAMRLIDLETCGNLERELFPKIIKMGRAVHYKLEGKKFAIETQQDLDIINQKIQSIHDIGDFVKKVKKELSDRQSLK